MPQKIKIAAVQMRSTYGDVDANLAKAENFIREAAQAGANLVVLPELFNTGYGYTPANYELTETPDEQTFRWLTGLAAELEIHLAGSFLLRKGEDIFNTLLLAAPDGQTWEYDKTHPWGWERAYFCPGNGPLIADTALGKIGMLICYDVAYPDLFAAYAGQVQLLMVSSCPPKVNRMTILFPDRTNVEMADTGPVAKLIQESGDHLFDTDLRDQAAWLGVPMVNAMPYGDFASPVPRAKLSFGVSVAGNPKLWNRLGNADQATISADYNQHTQIADANGHILAGPPEGDGFAIAEVEIPAAPPKSTQPQPKMRLHPASRWVSSLLSWLVIPEVSTEIVTAKITPLWNMNMDALVFGNVTLDVICYPVNVVPRHESIAFDDVTVSPGGCGSNTAIGLAALGVPTGIVARTGEDDSANLLFRYWERVGIDTRFVQRNPQEPTATSIGLVDTNFQPRFIHTPGANRGVTAEIIDAPAFAAAGTKFFHVAGFFVLVNLFKGVGAKLAELRSLGITTSLDVVFNVRMDDPKLRAALWDALPNLDYFLANDHEAFRLTGETDPVRAAAILKDRGAQNVIVKLGAQGCYALSDEFTGIVPALKVEVVDTTGGGDAFAAGFITALSRETGVKAACAAGNQAGARVVQKLGAIAAWVDEMETEK